MIGMVERGDANPSPRLREWIEAVLESRLVQLSTPSDEVHDGE
jgi:hypothetical protein